MIRNIIKCQLKFYLNGGARQKDTSFGLQSHERLVRLVLGVLQTVSFITEDETDFTLNLICISLS